jgi:GrpB-like predicted nucleotidyltransferase (UPF0157 family)
VGQQERYLPGLRELPLHPLVRQVGHLERLAFRDAPRADAGLRANYQAIKQRLPAAHP